MQCPLLTGTLQPHARLLQLATSRQIMPGEILITIMFAGNIHSTLATKCVPKSTSPGRGAVICSDQVVVSVISGEHHAVVVLKCIIASITLEPSHLQLVVEVLVMYFESTIHGVVPFAGVA